MIELSPSLTERGYFAPSNWAQLNSGDTDLGGIGGQISDASICDGAYGATAHVGYSVFVPCLDGVFDVAVSGSNLSVAWQTSDFDAGSPIVTGNVVWAVDTSSATLLGFNISTGQQLFSFALVSADRFISPSEGPGSVYVAGGSQLYVFALA